MVTCNHIINTTIHSYAPYTQECNHKTGNNIYSNAYITFSLIFWISLQISRRSRRVLQRALTWKNAWTCMNRPQSLRIWKSFGCKRCLSSFVCLTGMQPPMLAFICCLERLVPSNGVVDELITYVYIVAWEGVGAGGLLWHKSIYIYNYYIAARAMPML